MTEQEIKDLQLKAEKALKEAEAAKAEALSAKTELEDKNKQIEDAKANAEIDKQKAKDALAASARMADDKSKLKEDANEIYNKAIETMANYEKKQEAKEAQAKEDFIVSQLKAKGIQSPELIVGKYNETIKIENGEIVELDKVVKTISTDYPHLIGKTSAAEMENISKIKFTEEKDKRFSELKEKAKNKDQGAGTTLAVLEFLGELN